MEKLVSVIIPVYNVEKYLKRCIESVINQTYKGLEIILVNDGSTDNSGKMCDEYAKKDNRIKVIHKKNGGLSDARNCGIDIANGKYISFIDSDDYVELDYIKVLYQSIEENQADIAIGSHTVIYDSGTILKKETGEKSLLEPKEVLRRICYDDGIDLSAWAKMYSLKLFENIRYPKGRLFEDAATTYKLIDNSNKISIISKGIYNYIMRSDSITSGKFSKEKMDLIYSTEEMCCYIQEKYPELEGAANRRIMYAYLSTLSQLAMSKEKFPQEQLKMTSYVRKNAKKILKDSKVPRRDKFGILSVLLGFRVYKIIWKIYLKVTGRIRNDK